MNGQDATPQFSPGSRRDNPVRRDTHNYTQFPSSSSPSSPHRHGHFGPRDASFSQLPVGLGTYRDHRQNHSVQSPEQKPFNQSHARSSPIAAQSSHPYGAHPTQSSSRSRSSMRGPREHSNECRASQHSHCICDRRRDGPRLSRGLSRPPPSSPSTSQAQATDFMSFPTPQAAYTSFTHNRNASGSDSLSKRLPNSSPDVAYASFADLMLTKPRGGADEGSAHSSFAAPSPPSSFAVPTGLPSSRRNSKSLSVLQNNRTDFSASAVGLLQRSRHNSVSRMTDDGHAATSSCVTAPTGLNQMATSASASSFGTATAGIDRVPSSSSLVDDVIAAQLVAQQYTHHYRRSPSLSYRSTQVSG